MSITGKTWLWVNLLLAVLHAAQPLNAQGEPNHTDTAGPCLALGTICVGADADCQYSNLQDAINAASTSSGANTVIHVVRNQTYTSQSLVIQNRNITLRGGYDYCADYISSGKTIVSGSNSTNDSVIKISAPAGYRQVILRGLEIREGGAADGVNRGGGVNIRDNAFVDIYASDIVNNHSTTGGGIYIAGPGSPTLQLEGGSRIATNFSLDDGGGIACELGASIVFMDALVTDNRAGGLPRNGGGLFLDYCVLNAATSGETRGIRANHALGLGGGIYAGNNSNVTMSGSVNGAFELAGNDAPAGGGIYIERSTVKLDGVSVSNNAAIYDTGETGRGSGIFVDSSQLQLVDDACAGCSDLQGNHDGSSGTGAALYLQGTEAEPGIVSISGTRIADNSDFAISMDGGPDAGDSSYGALLTLSNTIVDHNGSFPTFFVYGKSRVVVTSSTLADNQGAGLLALLSAGSSARLDNLIVASQNKPVVSTDSSPFAQLEAHCILANAGNGLPVRGDILTADNPRFRDAEHGDYHLLPESPAIDFCAVPLDAPSNDRDGNPRGVDAPQAMSFEPGALYDLGAYEWTFVNQIFSDGFDID